jgi:hypothetical protein
MDTLTRAMRDAADAAPTTLDIGDEQWVESSWRSGRRRRAVRGVAAGAALAAAAAVVVSLVVSGIGGMPSASVPADGSSHSDRVGVSSYPQRIGHQWWVRDLPDRHAPVAGLLRVSTADTSEWQAVSPTGARYRLPAEGPDVDVFPAVSADGTRVAYFQGGLDRWLVHDLPTGRRWLFSEVGGPQGGRAADDPRGDPEYRSVGQNPAFFSPDGELLALLTSDGPVVLSTVDGSVVPVTGMGQAGGWLDDDHLLGRVLPGEESPGVQADPRAVQLVVWDRRTGRTSPGTRLELPDPGAGRVADPQGQWWGALRADGTLWLDVVVTPVGGGAQERWLLGYDPTSGSRVDREGRPTSYDGPPAPSPDDVEALFGRQWRGTAPLAGTDGGGSIWADGRVIVAVQSDVLDTGPIVFARDAINGSPSWTPFGTTDLLVLWWWKEIALVALVLGAWRWRVVRHRRRAVAR